MKRLLLVFSLIVLSFAPLAGAKEASFADRLDLSPLQSVSVQDQQTLKTFDSYARQTVAAITHRKALRDESAAYLVLDMSFRPAKYRSQNIIYIKHVPLRQDLAELESFDEQEKQRIIREGTISLQTWMRADVLNLMRDIQASAVHKARSIQEVDRSAAMLGQLIMRGPGFIPARLIAPASDDREKDHEWRTLNEVAGNIPSWAEASAAAGHALPAPLPGYDGRLLEQIAQSAYHLMAAWREEDAAEVNARIMALSQYLPQVNPERYPSQFKRDAEVAYNRLAKLTIPGAALYFIAFVMFLLGARSGVIGMRLWGLRIFVLAFLVHTLGIGVRWWLVEKSVGNWFESIPIKNQFESVLFSAWFGALVGLALEIRRPRGVFGAAAAFVGWMSLIAIFGAPYVAGREIGGEIGQVAGVLMSYWLYIHVTMVVASYALIGMSFMLGVWWLIRYYGHYRTIRKAPARRISADAAQWDALPGASGGGAVAMTFAQTLAMMLFVPRSRVAVQASESAADAEASLPREVKVRNFLATLDLCHVVILQLAFWILGVGIILGAVWADMSWGRPWGWDPKETFALVTWIVYLVVVHVRVATEDKAWWTAVLSILGFFVMLFNWIGVNFFLVGLHSYA